MKKSSKLFPSLGCLLFFVVALLSLAGCGGGGGGEDGTPTSAPTSGPVSDPDDPPEDSLDPLVGDHQEETGDEDLELDFTLSEGISKRGTPLSYILVLPATNGILSNCMNLAGSDGPDDRTCIYMPNADLNGAHIDGFSYKVNDGTSDSLEDGIVAINISPVDDLPEVVDQTENGFEDIAFNFTLASGPFDVDGEALSYILIGAPINGILSNCLGQAGSDGPGDRTCTYAPNADMNGTPLDNISYKVNDGTSDSVANATVAINVSPFDDLPEVVDQTENGTEDVIINFSLASGPQDADGDTLSYIIVGLPVNGILLNCLGQTGSDGATDRTCTYTPNANFNGAPADSFTYKVNDGTSDSLSNATVTINLVSVDDLPIAVNQTENGTEDVALDFSLASGPQDVDGESLSYIIVGLPANGTLSNCLGQAGSSGADDRTCTYAPNANLNGSPADSFTYKVNDGTSDSLSSAVVTINLAPVLDLPVIGSDQTENGAEDTVLNFTINEGTSLDGYSLNYIVVTAPANGTLTDCMDMAGSSGSDDRICTYTPNANVNGLPVDSFAYKVNDLSGDSVINAVVTINLVAVDDLPVAVDQTENGTEDVAHDFTLVSGPQDADGETLDYIIIGLPVNGTLTNCLGQAGSSGATDRTCTYTPNVDLNGSPFDSLTYKVNDGTSDSVSNAVVTINIAPVDDLPVAVDQTENGTEDVLINFTLASGPVDVDGEALNYIIVGLPANGTLINCLGQAGSSGADDRTCTYTPNADLNGTPADSFTYKVNDGISDSLSNAIVTINLSPIDDLPVAIDQTENGEEDVAHDFTLASGPTDVDGEALSYIIIGFPVNGTLTNCLGQTGSSGATDRTCTYTSPANLNGTPFDSFTYKVNDGTSDSVSNAVVTINIASINDPPTVGADKNFTDTMNEAIPVTLNGGSDIEGDSLGYLLFDAPAIGTLSDCMDLSGSDGPDDLTCIYTPDMDTKGAESFTYKANDGSDDSLAVTTVNIRVGDSRCGDELVGEIDGTSMVYEEFTAVNDLANTKICFVPKIGGGYSVYSEEGISFPITLIAGSSTSLGDDETINLATDDFSYYETTYSSLYLGSNGYISFVDFGTNDYSPTVAEMDDRVMAAFLWDDLAPNLGGEVYHQNLANRFVITFNNIQNFGGGKNNQIQTELIYSSGELVFAYGEVGSETFIVGISPGNLATQNVADFVNLNPIAPTDQDAPTVINESRDFVANIATNEAAEVLNYVVQSGPAFGILTNCMDQTGSDNGQDRTCTYTPNLDVTGADSITYEVFDGAVSMGTATITIDISGLPTSTCGSNYIGSVSSTGARHEIFSALTDIPEGYQICFTPFESGAGYAIFTQESTWPAVSIDPGWVAKTLTDDSYVSVDTVANGWSSVEYFGTVYENFRVDSNGRVYFSATGSRYYSSAINFDGFEEDRDLAVVWGDLNPEDGGSVYVEEDVDRIVVTYDQVPRYNTLAELVSAQLEYIYNTKEFIFTYGTVSNTNFVIGISSYVEAGESVEIDFYSP